MDQLVMQRKEARWSDSLNRIPSNGFHQNVSVQGCNYAKGEWVMDEKRPFYSGFLCKQWLSAMWACRLMQRTNFDYERLRWQPKSCQMEEFGGEKFLKNLLSITGSLQLLVF
ncbi:hypothetical protein MLD38_040878 [Melastoma candidum]|nr:hypothetical protein MLD38_040878 [Melastoma candidum]